MSYSARMSTTMMRRIAYLISLVAVLLALSLPAMASPGIVLATAETEQPADTEGQPAEGEEAPAGAEVSIPADLPEPAVPIEPEDEAAATPEWTFRFLVPMTLVLGGLAVIGTIIAYFVKVTKARYRVVE